MGAIALFAWSPWKEPTETEWLTTYRAWSDGMGASLAAGLVVSRADCETDFDEEVGQPSTERLAPLAVAARQACASPSLDAWVEGRASVVRALVGAHDEVLPPRRRPDIAEIATASVGVRPEVYCWRPDAWPALLEHYAIVRGGEEVSLNGIADRERNRIELDPGTCVALDRYLSRERPHELSYENFELAQGIVVLTHQAEHLKTPTAAEAEVECWAVQHVRPLVRELGWGEAFEREIPLQAWELGYQQLPDGFRSPECRNGGTLDRNPGSSVWP